MCARTAKGSEELCYSDSGTFIFLVRGSVLNATPVTNAFLSYAKLYFKCFFSEDIWGKHVGPSTIIFDIPDIDSLYEHEVLVVKILDAVKVLSRRH